MPDKTTPMFSSAPRCRRGSVVLGVLLALAGCKGDEAEAETPSASKSESSKHDADRKVGYDLRRLRPRNGESLAEMFERLRTAAVEEGKVVAVLFSADWCEPCRMLDLEFGNMHPASEIGHVRILEIKEEDWQAVTRMNEVNQLRTRWTPTINAYPVLVALDAKGDGIEEMRDAKDRLEAAGVEPTIPNWFKEVSPPAPSAG